MSFTVNKVILVGQLGKDAETRDVGDSTVTSFSLATNRSWKDASGEWKNETDWHNVQAWKLSDFIKNALVKGAKVYVEGSIRTRSYEKDGEKKYITEITAFSIIPLDKRESAPSNNNQAYNQEVNQDSSDLPF